MTIYNLITGDRIDLMILDGDGTIIDYQESGLKSSWDLVGHLYVNKELWNVEAAMWQEIMQQEKNPQERDKLYRKWVSSDAKQLRGKDATKAQQVEIPYTKGAKQFFRTIDGTVNKFILSGGLNTIFDRAATELRLGECMCNVLHIDNNNRFTGDFDVRVNPFDKAKYLPYVTKDPDRLRYAAVFGDSSGDLPLFNIVKEAGGLVVAVNPMSDEVAQAADIRITDFRELYKYIR